jgi:hypothetical protein
MPQPPTTHKDIRDNMFLWARLVNSNGEVTGLALYLDKLYRLRFKGEIVLPALTVAAHVGAGKFIVLPYGSTPLQVDLLATF